MAYYYSPFRKEYNSGPSRGCPFCNTDTIAKEGVTDAAGKLVENEHYYWMINWFPRMEGHTLIVPKRHMTRLEEETEGEVRSRQELTLRAAAVMSKAFSEWGLEIFLQTGKGSMASVSHLHWHVVPSGQPGGSHSEERFGHFMTEREGEEKMVMYPLAIELARQKLQEHLQKFM